MSAPKVMDLSSTSPVPGALFQNVCFTCNAPSKYRCPKCSTLSCSLECVKAHKIEKDCDGKRDETAFVPVENFQDRHLFSDYQFLEDINRTIDNVQRGKRGLGMSNKLPYYLFKLKMVAKDRNTTLCILPATFSRRKASTTYLRYYDRKIFWKLEWKFPLCDFTCCDEKIDEEQLLGKCLDKYLLPGSSELCDDKLLYYQSMGHKGVTVIIKDESCPANEEKYLVLNQNKSLRANLSKKKIVEFPTLLVVPKIHLSAYIE